MRLFPQRFPGPLVGSERFDWQKRKGGVQAGDVVDGVTKLCPHLQEIDAPFCGFAI